MRTKQGPRRTISLFPRTKLARIVFVACLLALLVIVYSALFLELSSINLSGLIPDPYDYSHLPVLPKHTIKHEYLPASPPPKPSHDDLTAYPESFLIPSLPAMAWGARPAVDPATYLRPITGSGDEAAAERQAAHAAIQRLRSSGSASGVLIPAGEQAPSIPRLLLLLRILRTHMRSPDLVEVMWQGREQMDKEAWAAISNAAHSSLVPIRGVDLAALKHPVVAAAFGTAARGGANAASLPLPGALAAALSLLASELRHVLVLDLATLPAQPLSAYFAHPQYLATGNLFWPTAARDAPAAEAAAYFAAHGVNHAVARPLLDQGKGSPPALPTRPARGTAGPGPLLIDRGSLLDVLTFLPWALSSGSGAWEKAAPAAATGSVVGGLQADLGQAFGLAFALAGKAHMFSQVAVPPAGLFSLVPATSSDDGPAPKADAWQLSGLLHHDSWGRPAFLQLHAHHGATPTPLALEPSPWHLATAPMDLAWVEQHVGGKSGGETPAVAVPAAGLTPPPARGGAPTTLPAPSRPAPAPTGAAVPASALQMLHATPTARHVHTAAGDNSQEDLLGKDVHFVMDPLPWLPDPSTEPSVGAASSSSSSSSSGSDGSNEAEACPVPTFVSVWAMKLSGLAVDVPPAMVAACLPTLRRLMGRSAFAAQEAAGVLQAPMLRYLERLRVLEAPLSHPQQGQQQPLTATAQPLPAWRLPFASSAASATPPPPTDGAFACMLRALQHAAHWLCKASGGAADDFPALAAALHEGVLCPPPDPVSQSPSHGGMWHFDEDDSWEGEGGVLVEGKGDGEGELLRRTGQTAHDLQDELSKAGLGSEQLRDYKYRYK